MLYYAIVLFDKPAFEYWLMIWQLARQGGFEEDDDNNVAEVLESHNQKLTNDDLVALEHGEKTDEDSNDEEETQIEKNFEHCFQRWWTPMKLHLTWHCSSIQIRSEAVASFAMLRMLSLRKMDRQTKIIDF